MANAMPKCNSPRKAISGISAPIGVDAQSGLVHARVCQKMPKIIKKYKNFAPNLVAK